MKPGQMRLLRERGVVLSIDKATGRLRYHVPSDTLRSADLRSAIAEAGMVYEERAGIREYSGKLNRADAERLAMADLLEN